MDGPRARPSRPTSATSASWADQELKAYRQVDLSPGESAMVEIEIAVGDLTIVDAHGVRVIEPGEFELRLGPSSRAETQLHARFTVVT